MRILLVEDDRKISRFIEKGLKENGYVVDVAFDGQEGLELALSRSYAIVILDILLPVMNGHEIVRTLRDKRVMTPVIFVTAKDTKEDIVQGLELGADDYLVKPFSFMELLARVRALLRRGQQDVDLSHLRVEDLSLDLLERTAHRGNQKIELSGKEFLLLEYLMKNAGQVQTRTMLLENVWGYNFDTSSNIVDVHINHLRNKIDKDFEIKLIHTIKGVGYVLKSG